MLARLGETAHYSGSPVCVGYPVLCMRFGAKFSACDLRFCIFLSRDTIHAIRLRELPFVIGLREEAFLKVYWEICKPHLLLVVFNHCQNSVEN